jgi:hypothetical protein
MAFVRLLGQEAKGEGGKKRGGGSKDWMNARSKLKQRKISEASRRQSRDNMLLRAVDAHFAHYDIIVSMQLTQGKPSPSLIPVSTSIVGREFVIYMVEVATELKCTSENTKEKRNNKIAR